MSVPDHEQGGDPACWAHLVDEFDDEGRRPQVILVAGSLRARSHTTALLRRVGELLPSRFEVVELDDVRQLPHYDADLDGELVTPAAGAARSHIAGAAAVVISTPEYNSTIPGGLKNWLDWVTRPVRQHVLIGKPVAVLGAAPNSKGAATAVAWLADILQRLGAIVVGEPLSVPEVAARIDDAGTIDPDLDRQLAALAAAIVAAVDASSAAEARPRPSS